MAKKYTNDELRKASDHLFYEIWMMNRLAAILENNINSLFPSPPSSYTHSTKSTLFIRSTGIITTSQNDNDEDNIHRAINNAIIEALAIHIRSLLDFFYTEGKDDDIVAGNFFSPPSVWIDARPPKTATELKKIKNRVNKEIAHLTFTRQKVKSKTWPFKEIQNNLNKVVEVFSSVVAKDLLGSRWE